MFERIGPNDLPRFLRQYRLSGGRIHRVRLLYPGLKKVAVEFYLTVRETIKALGTEPQEVRLVLQFLDQFQFVRDQPANLVRHAGRVALGRPVPGQLGEVFARCAAGRHQFLWVLVPQLVE